MSTNAKEHDYTSLITQYYSSKTPYETSKQKSISSQTSPPASEPQRTHRRPLPNYTSYIHEPSPEVAARQTSWRLTDVEKSYIAETAVDAATIRKNAQGPCELVKWARESTDKEVVEAREKMKGIVAWGTSWPSENGKVPVRGKKR